MPSVVCYGAVFGGSGAPADFLYYLLCSVVNNLLNPLTQIGVGTDRDWSSWQISLYFLISSRNNNATDWD
jgi:hypothetical protein